jgi:hypothetical protein
MIKRVFPGRKLDGALALLPVLAPAELPADEELPAALSLAGELPEVPCVVGLAELPGQRDVARRARPRPSSCPPCSAPAANANGRIC